ncbi:transglycosylase SLT domain-containing protein [Sulfitobacter sp. D35]|uniref:transglycosylase SLT domain-containing protein n=1 Tax=Sulfitobacter sp. D35 TaxID=3083252 RepID=UPI00296E6C46|nr:transglycosylase SLT domain-containing protein [Sulfitobacter sp. D35]MDW4497478.1 transglycosylase SLT domain-containing protein [Sulfitobacter sp. D35]
MRLFCLLLLLWPAALVGATAVAGLAAPAEAPEPDVVTAVTPLALDAHRDLPRPPAIRPLPPPPPPEAKPLPSHLPKPPAREVGLPQTRWSHMAEHALWNRVAISALKAHGRPLTDTIPDDIGEWCPHYPQATTRQRRAFWVGMMSALAKHESTYRQGAVGGRNQWFGLLQIYPGTARSYRCNARSGESLRRGGANLSCAVRIMARTVPRDGVIAAKRGRWMGVAADWAPMRVTSKRRDMQAWLRKQPYCVAVKTVRPRMRPGDPSSG